MILGKKMYARYQDTIKLESEENALRPTILGNLYIAKNKEHHPTLQEMYIRKKSSI